MTWRKIEQCDGGDDIQQSDLQTYFGKFGRIVDIDFQSEDKRAMIAFQTCEEAEFAVSIAKIVIKNHSVSAQPMKGSSRNYGSAVRQKVSPVPFDANCNLIVKNLDSDVSESLLYSLLSTYGPIASFRLNRKSHATFAYAAYAEELSFRRALGELDGSFHFGSHLKVEPYRTPEQRQE